MKKLLIFIIILYSTTLNAQTTKKYFERKTSAGVVDSGYIKFPVGDSVFLYSDNSFIARTKEYYDQFFNPDIPNGFSNFTKYADGVYRNFIPVAESVVSSTVGGNLLNISNPASASLIRVNSNGTVLTRTAAEAKQDLSIDQVDNTSDANKPISTATQTALNLKQNISGNTGGWTTLRVSGSNATTTGQSLVDVTGLVSGTLLNATLYEVEAVLYVSTSAVTTGTQYAITAGGTGAAAQCFMNVSGTTTTNAATTVTQSASGTAVGTFLTTSGASGIVIIRGYVLTRGSGTATISVQHLKVTSGTSTVLIGSVLRIRQAN